jgi:hypothetical protein
MKLAVVFGRQLLVFLGTAVRRGHSRHAILNDGRNEHQDKPQGRAAQSNLEPLGVPGILRMLILNSW